MNKTLLDAVRHLPTAYESTGLAFWDDEHISRSMLDAHLAPDADGASRRHAFIDESAAWIASLCPAGAALLDLGCGPGLYTRRLHRHGLYVTGMDFSKRSIEYAAQQAKRNNEDISYVYQDYMTVQYHSYFDASILIYCDYGVFSPGNRQKLLLKIHRALRPGGLLILDAFTPQQYLSFRDADHITHADEGFWSARPYVCLQRNRAYEGHVYLEQYTIVTAGACRTYNLWNHAFTPAEMQDELLRAGFARPAIYADATGRPMDAHSPTLCAVAAKAT